MPYTAEHKKKSREKILLSAINHFTRYGFEKSSIDQIMADAKLTRGAFYAHFKSKSDLYQQAILSGAMQSQLVRAKPDDMEDEEWLRTLVNGYLSESHVEHKDGACPLAFLVTDVAVSEPEVRHTYTRVFQGMNRHIASSAHSFANSREQDIYAATALLIGGVAIGRCLDNKKTLKKLLASCQDAALRLIRGEST
jgi:TetR/AcrR family transcriptional repressor of nem operon